MGPSYGQHRCSSCIKIVAIILLYVSFWALQNLTSLRHCKLTRLFYCQDFKKYELHASSRHNFLLPFNVVTLGAVRYDATVIYYRLWAWQEALVCGCCRDDGVIMWNKSVCSGVGQMRHADGKAFIFLCCHFLCFFLFFHFGVKILAT